MAGLREGYVLYRLDTPCKISRTNIAVTFGRKRFSGSSPELAPMVV